RGETGHRGRQLVLCAAPRLPAAVARGRVVAELEGQVGDGFSVELQGRFAAIRGISMSADWLYYTSSAHPEKCTLWRKLGWDPALIWRRHNGGHWTFDPGDGTAERPIKLAP